MRQVDRFDLAQGLKKELDDDQRGRLHDLRHCCPKESGENRGFFDESLVTFWWQCF